MLRLKRMLMIILLLMLTSGGMLAASSIQAEAKTKTLSQKQINTMTKKVPKQVKKALKKMRFKVIIDSSKGNIYAGSFDSTTRQIVLKRKKKGYLLHEMGHFVALLSGNCDVTQEFKTIYKKEAARYTGSNKVYVIKSSQEYFAESFRDYCTRKNTLKKQRPETYAYMNRKVASITDRRINMVYKLYYSAADKRLDAAKTRSKAAKVPLRPVQVGTKRITTTRQSYFSSQRLVWGQLKRK